MWCVLYKYHWRLISESMSHSPQSIWICYLHEEIKDDREPFHLYLSTGDVVLSMRRT